MNRPIALTRERLRVYLVLDLARAGSRATDLVRQSVAAGVTCIQLRDKRGSQSEVERVAGATRDLLRRACVPLIVNDRLDVALAVDAEGVHVGQTDEPVSLLCQRATLAGYPGFPVGVSVTTVDEARSALSDGAHHLSVSPVFASSSKPDAPRAAGLEGVRTLRREFRDTPIVAIGGVSVGNAASVIEAGADGVAFVSAVTDSVEPVARIRAIAASVNEGLGKRKYQL
ncbi:MAG: thiamine phosphate synthase [Myxococcota bacterium]